MPIKIVPKDNMGEEKIPAKKNMGIDSMMKKKNKKKKKSTESTGAFPFIAPGQMKMLHGLMGKPKPQTLNKGGKIYRPILKVNKDGKIVDSGKIKQPDGTIKINPKTYKFKNSGGKISKYYAGGGNVITGRD